MEAHSMDDLSISELPDLQELCGNVSPEGILPAYKRKRSRVHEVPLEVEASDKGDSPLPGSTSTERPVKSSDRTAESGRGVNRSLELPSKEAKAVEPPPKRKKAELKEGDEPTVSKGLTKAAKEMLCAFPRGQVVLRKDSLWPPEEPGYLDLFSGEKGVARAMVEAADVWVLCFDIEDGASQDLSDPELRARLAAMVTAGCFLGVGGGPVCRTFSMAVRPPVRSKTEPYGKAEVSEKMRAKLIEGNDMALWIIGFLVLSLRAGLGAWVENPGSSWFFRLPEFLKLVSEFPEFGAWTVDYCRFGTKWRKRTKFYNNSCLRGLKTLCQGGHVHQHLKGRSRTHRKSWTLVAQPYPAGVARVVAMGMLARDGFIDLSQKFDPGCCAKAGCMRIGEASHPGPRVSRAFQRTGLLEEVSLVEPKTRALQDKVWNGFLNWLNSTLSPGAVRSAMAIPSLLVLLAKEYGNFLYSSGRSLYVFRHLLVFLQQNFVTIRPHMGICWGMVTRWEMMEPTEHRVPLPYTVFRAMLSVALGWSWVRFASILILGFLGIARPGEPLQAFRSDLILPRDMLTDDFSVAYLRIQSPKTRNRGRGKTQHISVHDERFIRFLDKILGELAPHERLFNCSGGAFRRRWDAVLKALHVPSSSGLTPGGVRGGGCVYAFQCGADINMLLWRMRIKHLQTLESYLQEVVASTVVSELPVESRSRISIAANLAFHFLDARF
eukprot:Skav206449  [mRNA]  locus=scaffold230:22037:24193:- [translate_table: standard]